MAGASEGPAGRIGIVVSRFNESVTSRLLTGARACLAERGVPDARLEVHWVAGAWELPVLARALMTQGGFDAIIALGAVVRGETPHFEYVAGEAAHGLMSLQVRYGVPVGFGLLTCDTMEQALARAGGAAGNKGFDAAAAALDAAALVARRAGPR
jgi:6,7-dimethyl-8-ribityllumazine synthase